MLECFPSMHEILGSVPSTKQTEHGGALLALRRWRREDWELKVIFRYLGNSRPVWVTCYAGK